MLTTIKKREFFKFTLLLIKSTPDDGLGDAGFVFLAPKTRGGTFLAAIE